MLISALIECASYRNQGGVYKIEEVGCRVICEQLLFIAVKAVMMRSPRYADKKFQVPVGSNRRIGNAVEFRNVPNAVMGWV